tara:strand:+ start:5078 stop:5302 length:225 start_codon:yes stop_codon:yes gene_type:complete
MLKKLWRTWKYALGSFSDEKTKRYDNSVVIVRSIIFVTYLVTNCFIVAGVIRHWGDSQESVPLLEQRIADGAIL